MPLVIAGAMAAGATIYAAHKQSNSADKAAQLQSQANTQALDFEKQQAQQEQANYEAAQKGNYDQWRAREERVSQLGPLVGLPARQIPDYVPTTNVTAPGSSQQAPPPGRAVPRTFAPGSPASYLSPRTPMLRDSRRPYTVGDLISGQAY